MITIEGRQQMIYEYAMAVVSLNEDTISYGQMPDLIRLLGGIVQKLDAASVTDGGSWELEADPLISAELVERGIL
jgi:hypothetical protein